MRSADASDRWTQKGKAIGTARRASSMYGVICAVRCDYRLLPLLAAVDNTHVAAAKSNLARDVMSRAGAKI